VGFNSAFKGLISLCNDQNLLTLKNNKNQSVLLHYFMMECKYSETARGFHFESFTYYRSEKVTSRLCKGLPLQCDIRFNFTYSTNITGILLYTVTNNSIQVLLSMVLSTVIKRQYVCGE